MTETNALIDRLIQAKDKLIMRSDRDAINDACAAISAHASILAPLETQLAFLLSVAKDDKNTIDTLDAELKESRTYALALEQELRDRAAAIEADPERRET